MVLDDAEELALLGADEDQLHDLAFATLVRVVEQDLGPVGVEAPGSKRMIDADLLFQDLDVRSDRRVARNKRLGS